MVVGPSRITSDVLTPDFYDYDWAVPDSASIDGRFVVVRWGDGVELRAFDLWLREVAVGTGVDPATREGVIDPADLTHDIRVDAADIDGDGALAVRFTDHPRVDRYHPGWLRHIAVGAHLPAGWIPEPTPWTTAELDEPPTHAGTEALAGGPVLDEFVDDLLRFGIARLSDVPVEPDAGRELAGHLGGIRPTNFGDLWDVRAMVDLDGDALTNSTANTKLRLGPHTDLPTRETPPGFQFLHCIANDVAGGESTMTDGLALVDHLRRFEPEHYEALTTLRWVFFNRAEGIDHRWSGPIIDLGVAGSPLTLRAFYPVRGFPDMSDADLPRAYAAMAVLSRLADDAHFQMRTPFRPGDLVAFDNRRILHGRQSYSSTGTRHLRGFYMDHDDVRSFARVTNRRRAAGTRPAP